MWMVHNSTIAVLNGLYSHLVSFVKRSSWRFCSRPVNSYQRLFRVSVTLSLGQGRSCGGSGGACTPWTLSLELSVDRIRRRADGSEAGSYLRLIDFTHTGAELRRERGRVRAMEVLVREKELEVIYIYIYKDIYINI